MAGHQLGWYFTVLAYLGRIMKSALLASVLFLCAATMYSQTTVTDDGVLKRNAYKILAETPHRVTMTIDMRETAEAPWELYSSQVKEVVGKDRWHLVQHTGLKLELIGIGERMYQKVADGTWRFRQTDNGYTGPTIRSVSRSIGQPRVIDEKRDGSKTIETSDQSTLQIIRTGEVVNNDRKVKEWFDEGGRLIRVENEHFNFERKKFQRVTEVYEYDPTIRIEVPIN